MFCWFRNTRYKNKCFCLCVLHELHSLMQCNSIYIQCPMGRIHLAAFLVLNASWVGELLLYYYYSAIISPTELAFRTKMATEGAGPKSCWRGEKGFPTSLVQPNNTDLIWLVLSKTFLFMPLQDGALKLSFEPSLTMKEVENENSVVAGGQYQPPECTARQSVAILVPQRSREKHLLYLLHHLHPFLQRQQLRYAIYVIQQVRPETSPLRLQRLGFLSFSELFQTGSDVNQQVMG